MPTTPDSPLDTLRADAVLRPLVTDLPSPAPRIHLSEVYPSLLRAIVGQQVSTKAAAAIYRRFLAGFDLDPDDPLAVPAPRVLAKADPDFLRGLGLSRGKASYVIALAEYFEAHPNAEADLRAMSDEEVAAELTSIRGVGKWTAEMMMIFAMGRPDLLPLDDLAIYQSMIELYGLDPTAGKRQLKAEMTAIAEAWRPHRSLACLYLYAYRHATRGQGAP